MSLMKERVDSLLGGPKDVCLDSARAIGERILHNDTIKNDLRRRQDVLEILAYTARMKKDTTGWMQWTYELIDVCRKLGGPAETDALRTEADVGAALYALGRHEEGMAKLDHVIEVLSEKPDFKFNELDALIIALKRKILLLSSPDQYAEILPLARRILERLDKYEKDPDAFHDGSLREPKTDERRADYKNNRIRRKNHVLAQQIAEALKYKEKFRLLSDNTPDPSSLNSMTDEQLYQYIEDTVIREHLFCDPKFGRETIMERFHLSKERVGTIFSKSSEYGEMSTYILKLRLDYAAKLLMEQPDKTVVQIASDSGFSSSSFFSNCFRQQFGMTPTDYRRDTT